MNTNDYKKIVHASIWYEDKILLSKRLKEGYHQGYWSDVGGKVEPNEYLLSAIQRETAEEIGLFLREYQFNLIDCYIYDERKLKTFLFEVRVGYHVIKNVINLEPEKHSAWRLFSEKQALRLKLMPSVKYYLENLK